MTPRIILVAEHASTRFGGEAILPYHYFRLLRARGVDAWLVVHERTRKELEEAFAGDLDRMKFVPDKLLQKIFYQVGRLLPRRIDEATLGLANQMLTQLSQRSIARELANGNSVVHQPIPVSPRFPSLMSNVGSPVVMGPMNGGMEYPAALRGRESAMNRAAIAVGRIFSNVVNALFDGKRAAAVVMTANARTAAALPNGLRGRLVEICENGVDLSQWSDAPNTAASQKDVCFTFIGRLVDWKALDIVLQAMRQCPEAKLDVIGDGPMFALWRRLAKELALEDRVHFHGWLSQSKCAEHLQSCTALVLPSLFECGGAVVLEAMASRRAVIATAWGGPLDYLDSTCGILVEPASRGALTAGFAAAMQRLIDSPEEARKMGEAGRARLVEHFDWQKKIDAMLDIYASALPATK